MKVRVLGSPIGEPVYRDLARITPERIVLTPAVDRRLDGAAVVELHFAWSGHLISGWSVPALIHPDDLGALKRRRDAPADPPRRGAP